MKKFSVIILSYNTDYKRLKMTLESILNQIFSNYEIIITDDASKNNHFNEIEKYLIKRNFLDYQLISNENNLGIVNNALNALEKSKGKYVKFIGSGDLLYNQYTLRDMYSFLNSNNYHCGFGILETFNINRDRIKFIENFDYCVPKLLKIYKKKKINVIDNYRILSSLIFRYDTICGASMFFEKEYVKNYLLIISGHIKYVEDLIRVLIFLDNDRMHYMDKKVVWYELGTGVSTSNKRNKYKKLLLYDNRNFIELLGTLYKGNRIVRKAVKVKDRIPLSYVPVLKYIEEILWFISRLRIIKKSNLKSKGGFLRNKRFCEALQLKKL